jgi:hypothetical protein
MLKPCFSSRSEGGNRQALAIASVLRENKGLVHLDLSHCCFLSDETWDAVCDSLKAQPTLEVLRLCSIFGEAPAAITSRIQALLDMMKVNMSIHTIHLYSRYMLRMSLLPLLLLQVLPHFLLVRSAKHVLNHNRD